jgi:spermidine synthase
VKPWETIEKATSPDGTELVLARRDDEWVVRYGGKVLMSSRQHGSEDALAKLALEKAKKRRAVLVGGMGLGFTARAALDRIPVDSKVVVAELTPALVDWNRRLVGKLAGRPLDDPRCKVHVGDVVDRIREAHGAYDAILLDVDNGPSSMVHESNHRLYGSAGVASCRAALAEGGVLAVWSAHHDEPYLERLQRGGFEATSRVVAARGEAGGLKHVLFLAVKADPPQRGRAAGRSGGKPGTRSGGKSPHRQPRHPMR